jgi:hypothetical protein
MAREWRSRVTALLVASAVTALAYRGLAHEKLEQTSALFVGLPLLLGLLTTHLTRASSVYGRVIRANVVFLAIVAPLLGEGSICLLMAAPIFIGVSLLGAFLFRSVTGPKIYGIAALPFLLGIAERQHLGEHTETVVTRTIVSGSADDWRARVRSSAPVRAARSRFLRLGFPLPVTYSLTPGRGEIAFSRAEGVTGSWLVESQANPRGVHFRVVKDTTKIAHWMNVLDADVAVEPHGATEAILVQTTRFAPLLRPAGYFTPLERYAIEKAHELARDCWSP